MNMQHLAELTRLHRVTVSRILRGTYTGSSETRQRVLKQAEKLGYRPNIFAQAIHHKPLPIAAAIGEFEPLTLAYLRQIQSRLAARAFSLLLERASGTSRELLDRFLPVATLVFDTTHTPQWAFLYGRADVIAINSPVPAEHAAACYRIQNEFAAGFRDLGRRLLELGHRRFLYVTRQPPEQDHAVSSEKRRGLREALREAGRPGLLLEEWASAEAGLERLQQRLGAPAGPTAVVCENDLVAHACLIEIQRLGLRVPRDVSVVGCDALRLVREWPGLASLRVQHEAIATCVADWITGEIWAAKTRGAALQPKTRSFACALADGWTMGPAPDAGVR